MTATLETHPNGQITVNAQCRECARPIVLPCHDDTGEPVTPNATAMLWADLLICSTCAENYESERARAQTEAGREKRIQQAKIPKAFRGLRFDDMIATGQRQRAIMRAREWATNPDPGGVFLYGPTGTGKTRLAATATWARLSQWPVRWVSVAVLFAQLQAAFSSDERKQALAVLVGDGPLVLDDLDKVALSDNSKSQLYIAIDRRIAAGAPLLVTANVAPLRLGDVLGSMIASRLTGYCTPYELDGPDRRLSL